MLLSLVFSFRNEENALPELIERCRKVLASNEVRSNFSDYELIFVDDCSTDRSLEILMNESEVKDDIRVITMSRCFGISPCALAGMERAQGDAVIYMDADLQDPPEVIPDLIKAWKNENGVEVVHTVRKSRKGESPIKMAITKIGYWILNRVTPFRLKPETGDFKFLSRRVVNHLTQMKEKRPFLRGLIYWIGFKQIYVSYHRDARHSGKTKFPIFSWRVISNFFESALISFSSIPLQMASVLGLAAIVIDLFLLMHVIHEKIIGKAIPGWSAIMVALIFVGSVQLLCLGILGMYISTIYEESKGRPNYIVANTFGFKRKDSA